MGGGGGGGGGGGDREDVHVSLVSLHHLSRLQIAIGKVLSKALLKNEIPFVSIALVAPYLCVCVYC